MYHARNVCYFFLEKRKNQYFILRNNKKRRFLPKIKYLGILYNQTKKWLEH